ncbi:tetratricopeptide repeat protein [Pseudoduganella sp. R-31]|uniref:tetratricopeptide repeat protein n=1 Tax=unclassified Pseudoduganella TaxID=2637179 RepID=UPI003CF987C9
MRKTIIAACVGMVAACSTPVLPPPPAIVAATPPAAPAPAALARDGRYEEAIALLEQRARRTPGAALLGDLGYAYYLGGHLEEARAALERACLMAPSSPVAWERLAALLETTGDSGRALEAMRHARLLREAASEPGAGTQAASGSTPGSGLWPAGMAHVEVRQVSAGLVEVARVEDKAPPPVPAPNAPTRLEVSNGNGIRGMAAVVAQRLRAEGMQVVRLTNTIPFNVEETRVEIRGSGEPQLRIVLGKDAAIKKPPGVSGRQAP